MERSNKLEELIKTSKNKEELRDSIKEAGIELSDEEIEAVVGGSVPEVPSFYTKGPNGAATATSS